MTDKTPAQAQPMDAVGARLQRPVRPRAWTLQSELDAGDSTCGAHLWFTNPVNSAWAPLYDQATLDAAVAAERERCAKVAESWCDYYNSVTSIGPRIARAIRGPNVEVTGRPTRGAAGAR